MRLVKIIFYMGAIAFGIAAFEFQNIWGLFIALILLFNALHSDSIYKKVP